MIQYYNNFLLRFNTQRFELRGAIKLLWLLATGLVFKQCIFLTHLKQRWEL